MKIALNQLNDHLSKTLLPIYLFCGDEILLIKDAVSAVVKSASARGFTEKVTITADSNTDISKHIYQGSHSISLFAEKKIIILNLSHIKLNATNGKQLEEYAQNPEPNTVLIIYSNKLDARVEKSAWFKLINKNGVYIPVWPLQTNQLPTWIIQRAKNSNLNITYEAAVFLASQTEGNLLAADQEIEKLSLLKPNATFDIKEISATVTDDSKFDIFNLVDCSLAGNLSQTFKILHNLKFEGTEPTLILWAISRELRTLLEIKQQQSAGTPIYSLFKQFRIWEKRQPAVNAALSRHSQKAFTLLLLSCANLDKIIKGASIGNFWDDCENLLLGIAQPIVE